MKKLIVFAFILLWGGSLLFSEKPLREKPDKDSLTDSKLRPKFPSHWGKPPAAQTKDLVDLPGGFGKGSSTLASWIKENIKENGVPEKPVLAPSNLRRTENETLQALREEKSLETKPRKNLSSFVRRWQIKGTAKCQSVFKSPKSQKN